MRISRQDTTGLIVFGLGAAALAVTDQPPTMWGLFLTAALATLVISARGWTDH